MFGIFNGAILIGMTLDVPKELGLVGALDGRIPNYANICSTRGSFEEFISAQTWSNITNYGPNVDYCYDQLMSPEVCAAQKLMKIAAALTLP
eukprot:scaffold125416_cov50-Prasinocladus_malaysianus.AAC.1